MTEDAGHSMHGSSQAAQQEAAQQVPPGKVSGRSGQLATVYS